MQRSSFSAHEAVFTDTVFMPVRKSLLMKKIINMLFYSLVNANRGPNENCK